MICLINNDIWNFFNRIEFFQINKFSNKRKQRKKVRKQQKVKSNLNENKNTK
jgi:hypothetical protein